MLPINTFYRIHKSYLININLIDTYHRNEGNYVIMKNQSMLEVSERNRKEFINKLIGFEE